MIRFALTVLPMVMLAGPAPGQEAKVEQKAAVSAGPAKSDPAVAATLEAIRVMLGSMDARLTALEQRGTAPPPLAVAPPAGLDAAFSKLDAAADKLLKLADDLKAPAVVQTQKTDVKIVPNARVREDDDPPAPAAYRKVTSDDPNSLPVGTLKYEGGRWYRLTGAGAWVPHTGATPAVQGVAVASVPTVPVVTGTILTTGVRSADTSPLPAGGRGLSVGSTRTGLTITSVPSAGAYGTISGGCASGGCAAAGTTADTFSFTGPFGGGFRRARVR